MKLMNINQVKIRSTEYEQELKELKQAVNDAYINKMHLKYDSCEQIAKRIIKADEDITQRLNKSAAYRTEYDALMNEKRIRQLTQAENYWAKILKSNIDYYDGLRDDEFERLKVRLKCQEISEDEYYSSLAVLRDTYFENGSSGWAKYTMEIAEYNKDIITNQKKEIEKLLGDVEDKYSKSVENILKKQEKMYNKLTGISEIYNRISINGANEGETYSWLQLSNIDAEIEALKNYNSSIIKAKERTDAIFDDMGLDENKKENMKELFFSQLSKLNIPEGTGFSNYLSNISDKRLSEYLTKWVEKIDLSSAISKGIYQDETNELINDYTEEMANVFSDGLKDKLSNIPDSFFLNGESSAKQFKEGFIGAIDGILEEISYEMDKKIKAILPEFASSDNSKTITNTSNFNIYGATDAKTTALEIYKQEALKRMLVGE